MSATLENLPKTERYLERKKYNEKLPKLSNHNSWTKQIDSLITVALHMRESIVEYENNRTEGDFELDFNDYICQYGSNLIFRTREKGILQTTGFKRGNTFYPFMTLTANEEGFFSGTKKTCYMRCTGTLESIFNELKKGYVEDSEIVGLVETAENYN
jgi:hypothetical protein